MSECFGRREIAAYDFRLTSADKRMAHLYLQEMSLGGIEIGRPSLCANLLLWRRLDLGYVDSVRVRIEVDQNGDMLAFMALQSIRVTDRIGLVVLIVGELFAILADSARHIAVTTRTTAGTRLASLASLTRLAILSLTAAGLALTAALVLRPGDHRQRNCQGEHHCHQCLHKGNSFSGHFCVTLFALYQG